MKPKENCSKTKIGPTYTKCIHH